LHLELNIFGKFANSGFDAVFAQWRRLKSKQLCSIDVGFCPLLWCRRAQMFVADSGFHHFAEFSTPHRRAIRWHKGCPADA